MKKNAAGQVVGIKMIALDGSAFTGAVTIYITGNNGSRTIGSVGSGICTHKGGGDHTYAPAQSETNYDHVLFSFEGAGAVPAGINIYPGFPQSGDSFARIGAPANASLAADVAAIDAQLPPNLVELNVSGAGEVRIDEPSATLVQQLVEDPLGMLKGVDDAIVNLGTRTVAGLVGGRVPVTLEAIDNDTSAAVNLKNHAKRAVPVTFGAGGTTTTAILATVDGASPNNASDQIYKNAALVFSAPAALKDQRALIQSYNASTGVVTITQVAAAVGADAVAVLT
jgi:hypothetical protein